MMDRTKLTRTLLAACSAVVLSAVLYGCGGVFDYGSQDSKGGAFRGAFGGAQTSE